MSVSTSAAASLNALFATVTTTANSVNTTVTALGNLAEELNHRSQVRLVRVVAECTIAKADAISDAVDNAAAARAIKMSTRLKELERDPAFAKLYSDAVQKYEALLAPPAKAE